MSGFITNPELHGSIPRVDGREEKERPMWSVVIPTHNCAGFLEQTLSSVLDQDPGTDEMEILVVDDHSTKDDPEEVVRRLAGDRVTFIRQEKNVGKARNYETGIAASSGQLVHQLHGDDRVGRNFYQSMQEAFATFPEAGAFFCESNYIDADSQVTAKTGKERSSTGIIDNWLEKIVLHQRVQTPSIVLRREVYERLGAFDRRLDCFEDWEMWIRTATQFPFGFNADVTADYRVYSQNTSYQSIVSGRRTRILRQMFRIVDAYLPDDILKRCRGQRSLDTAHYLIRCVPTAIANRSLRGWLRLCRESLHYSMHPRVLYYLMHFTLRYRRYV